VGSRDTEKVKLVKPLPRITPSPAAQAAQGGIHDVHDPYLKHQPRKHQWTQLPDRVHLGRGFRLRGRITHTNAPRHHGAD
jgi:hypothetical protein